MKDSNFIAFRFKKNERQEQFYALCKSSGLSPSQIIRCAINDFIDGKFEYRKQVMDSVKLMKKENRPEWIYV